MAFKKSKYKANDAWNWWEQELYQKEESEALIGELVDEDGYNTPHYAPTPTYYVQPTYGWYKPKYDMSFDLETRVTQLIKTVTGKSLKVVKKHGWGNDDKYFYYNPADLESSTDDEVLGRILHQLAKERHIDTEAVSQINREEPSYRHLLNTLEDSRADNLLQKDYPGCKYYADDLWQARKFTENPINNAAEDGVKLKPRDVLFKLMAEDEGADEQKWSSVGHNTIPDIYFTDVTVKKQVDDWLHEKGIDINNYVEKGLAPNDSHEFCFNIMAKQNGEHEWDFSNPSTEEGFAKALPAIGQYLNATSFDEAMAFYPEIKKYYPVPNSEQQQQMDNAMQGIQGLSEKELEQAGKLAAHAEKTEGEGKPTEEFVRDFALDNWRGDFKDMKRNLATYKKYLAEHQGSANTLHKLIRSILQDNSIKRFNRPFKRGKLDANRIYKFLATDNLRIFKKPRVVNDKKYAMSIIVDMSGSMVGGNAQYATKGAIVISNVLEQLKFDYNVLAYNGKVYTVKKFGESLKPELLAVLEGANGDNNELETIKVLTKQIVNFDGSKTHQKAVFWITDGQAYSPDEVKRRVTLLEKEHNATVFAIGIGGVDERYLKQSYNNYLIVNNIAELPKELIRLMRTQFRRHG